MAVTFFFGAFYLSLAGIAVLLARKVRTDGFFLSAKRLGGSRIRREVPAERVVPKEDESISEADSPGLKDPEFPGPEMHEAQPEAVPEEPGEQQAKTKRGVEDQLIPREIIPLVRKAETLIARKELDEAKKVLIRILSWDEDNADAGAHLAYVYLQTGEFAKAENLFRKVLEVRPRDPSLLTNFALSVFEQKDPERTHESIDALRRAAELDAQNSQRFSNLGQSLFFAGDLEGAAKAFDRAVKISPKNLEYLFFLADTYLSLEKYTEAKKAFQKILDLQPLNKEARYELDQLTKVGY